MIEHRGKLSGKDKKIGIVISRFNDLISKRLLDAAKEAFLELGGSGENLYVYWAPGAFEIPLILKRLAESGNFDGIVALGAVIRGETPHFEYIATEVSKGIARLSLEYKIPITFGVITADSLEQAMERAGGKLGNRGRDSIFTLLETVDLLSSIR